MSSGVSNAQLIDWSNQLLALDVNNCLGEYSVDIQGSTAQCSTSDQASEP